MPLTNKINPNSIVDNDIFKSLKLKFDREVSSANHMEDLDIGSITITNTRTNREWKLDRLNSSCEGNTIECYFDTLEGTQELFPVSEDYMYNLRYSDLAQEDLNVRFWLDGQSDCILTKAELIVEIDSSELHFPAKED
jgi:hypothetical protein